MRKSLRRGLRITLTTVLAAIVLALLPAAVAGATTPAPVTFNDFSAVVSGAPGPGYTFDVFATGTSTASGALSGTFALVDHVVIAPGGTYHLDRTLTDVSGTIAIRIDSRLVAFTATTRTLQGDWTITSGSGSYTSLHGGGTYSATVTVATETVDGTATGFAQYDAGS